MFILKGISILCSFFMVPITIGYVSSYEYGIWLTISSLIAWLSFFDIGIGNGLRNKFIECVEKRDFLKARIYVSTAYAFIAIIICIVWVLATGASFFIDWVTLLNAKPSLESELLYTIIIAITNFSVLFVLGLNRTLLNAIQKPALASIFDTLTQILFCLVLLILTKSTTGNLIYLALSMGSTSIFILIISNIWTFKHLLKQYTPSIKFVKFSYAKEIMSQGVMFFFLQILAIAFYQTNNLIITHYLGPDEVTVYNIAFKYLQILPMVFGIILAPFWSAFAEARVNEDYLWMKQARKRLMQSVLFLAILGLLMVLGSPLIYRIWIKDVVAVPFIVTVLVFLYQVLNIWASLWTQLLAGLGKMKLQVICSSICCLSYVPIACTLCNILGLTGLLIASVGIPLICTSWFGVIQVDKLLNHSATGIWAK